MATIQGSNFSEVLHGHSVQDYIYAYGGNDAVYAHGGNDYVDGGTGNDTIIGGEGADGLTGGAGYDVFKYNSASETWYDAIWDFNKAYDYVDLSGIDAKSYELFNPGTWGNQAFNWKGQLVGQGLSKGDLGYQLVGNDTYLYGNTDSDAAYEVQLRIAGHHHLSTADIYL